MSRAMALIVAVFMAPIATAAEARIIAECLAQVETNTVRLPSGRLKFTPHTSPTGAMGPTQLKPGTLKMFMPLARPGRLNEDPEWALLVTSEIMLTYRAQYGSWETAIAAWRFGARHARDKATDEYVVRVMNLFRDAKNAPGR